MLVNEAGDDLCVKQPCGQLSDAALKKQIKTVKKTMSYRTTCIEVYIQE